MRALIEESGRIAQIEADDFPVAKPLRWVDVPEDTTTFDTFVDGQVVKFVEPAPVSAPTGPLGVELIAVLTDAEATAMQSGKARDLWTILARGGDQIPQTNAKVQRLASKAGITVADWFGRKPA